MGNKINCLTRKKSKSGKHGLYACPISTVIDNPYTYQMFKKHILLPENKIIIEVLKAGLIPEGKKILLTHRLEPETLIIDV